MPPKKYSSPDTLKQYHLQIFNEWKQNKWTFWYCDGSKSEAGNGFAIVEDNGLIIKKGLVPHYSSIFTSEITTIEEALNLKPPRKKLVICSDSLSSINAIKNLNNNEPLVTKIRESLLRQSKTKLLYTPGHIGIRGNELADKSAKEAVISPTIYHNNYTKKDIKIYVNKEIQEQNQQSIIDSPNAYYKIINPTYRKIKYKTNLPKYQQKVLTRLRLGHSKLTHEYHLKKESPPLCSKCNSQLTMSHLISCYNNTTLPNSLLESIKQLDFNTIKKHLPVEILKDL